MEIAISVNLNFASVEVELSVTGRYIRTSTMGSETRQPAS